MKRIAIIAAAACMVLAGCSKEEPIAPHTGGPITLHTTVSDRPDGFTRATTENSWSGGEQIAVNMRGEVRKYVADASGMLTAARDQTPFYWQGDQEQVAVRAWYFGGYLSAEPEAVTVQADQSSEGYGASDYLFASGTVDRSNPTLVFSHKTVKVVVHVRADGRKVQSLRLGNANMALTAPWNKTTERIEQASGGSGTVTMHEVTADAGFDASFTALLVPQDMSGREFIRVTVGGHEYSFTPPAGEAVLEGGKCYTYKVTVLDAITVEPVIPSNWYHNDSEQVSSYTVYTADMLKAGDYLYLDCSWSDGGLRRRYSDGRLEWADPKPAPVEGKKVIGIVFQTDLSRIGAREKELFAKAGKPLHGVAMATRGMREWQWYYNENLDEPYTLDESIENMFFPGLILPNIFSSDDYKDWITRGDADISGYFNTEVITTRHANDVSTGSYPIFAKLTDFTNGLQGPSRLYSTGWYLPSIGQWFDFLRNLSGCTISVDDVAEIQAGTDGIADIVFWEYGNIESISRNLNAAIALVPHYDKTDFMAAQYWSSSAATPSRACSILIGEGVYGSNLSYLGNMKNAFLEVRYAVTF